MKVAMETVTAMNQGFTRFLGAMVAERDGDMAMDILDPTAVKIRRTKFEASNEERRTKFQERNKEKTSNFPAGSARKAFVSKFVL
jgi:hypothetical protein